MSELLDTVFEEEILDVITTQNYVFRANNTYEGLNEFTTALPRATQYIVPDSDEDLVQKKYVDDNFAHLQNNNKFEGIHEVNNILLRGSSNTHIPKIDFKYPVVYDINTDYNDIVMSSIASDVTRQGALIIKQYSYRDIEFKNILDETIAKVPIENGSPVAPSDIVTLQFCDQRYRDPVSNVNNTADIDKPISNATQTALDLKASTTYVDTKVADLVSSAPSTLNTLNELAQALGSDPFFSTTITGYIGTKAPIDSPTFIGNVSGITKAMVGLSNVDNTSDANKPISSATQTALDTKAPINNPTFTGTVGGVTKSMVGLSNVDNTSDANKPISSATQTALDLKANITYVNAQVASIVNSAPTTLDTLNELSTALGNDPNFATTTANAIGLRAPINNPTFTGTVGGITKSMVGLSNVDNTTDANKPVSTATTTALNLKANLASPTFTGTLGCDALTPTGLITSTRFTEVLTSVSHSSNVYNLSFNTSNCFFSANNTSGNFTVNIVGIPTSSSTRQFTFTLITNSPTHVCSSASATDTASTSIVSASTPKYLGSSTAPTVPTNVIAIHTFTLVQCFTNKFILYNVTSFN